MTISLVSTVLNDRDGVLAFLEAMARQSLPPDQIVLVDGGSRDGTWELLKSEEARSDRLWRLVALREDQCNVARGRNLAIQAASGAIIVSTDIGCDWNSQWLEEMVIPFEYDPGVHLVNGSWAVREDELSGPWAHVEWAIKGAQEFYANDRSHSSSRSIAYRRACWKALGGYPEDLTLAADDAVYAILVEKAAVPRTGAPTIRCWWHRHETLRGFFKEAFRYGLGDGEAGIRGKDVALIGGRMLMEFSCLLLGLVWLLPWVPLAPWLGVGLLAVAASSVAVRVWKMRLAVGRLKGAGVNYPLARLLTFTYGTKWHWLRGYAGGLRRGRVYCLDCRRRLQEMTPDLYEDKSKTAFAYAER
jgi:GT2 family glycosyltransferase